MLKKILILLFLCLPSIGHSATYFPKTYINVYSVFGSVQYVDTPTNRTLACLNGSKYHALQNNRVFVRVVGCSLNTPAGSSVFLNTNYYYGSQSAPTSSGNLDMANFSSPCNGSDTKSNTSPLPSGTCTSVCNAPFVFDTVTNTCSNDNCMTKRNTNIAYDLASSVGASNDVCLTGCVVQMVNGDCGFNVAKVERCFMTGSFTGASCTADTSTAAPANDPAYDCIKSGKTYGLVNGVAVCVAKGTKGSSPVTSTTTPTKTTSSDTGTTSETKTVTQDGNGKVTSTTVTTNPDGTQTTKTQEATKDNFCEANPNASICKQTSDPCSENPDRVGCSDKGTPSDTENLGNSTINSPTFSEVSIVSMAGCPASEVVNIGGHSIELSYAPACYYADKFRPVILAFAYLTAAVLIAGAIKS